MTDHENSRWFAPIIVFLTVLFVAVVVVLAARTDPAPLAGRVAGQINRLHGVMYYDPEDQPSIDQQNAFGPYWSDLTTFDCRANATRCESLGIDEVPTILIPGMPVGVSGYQELTDLESILNEIVKQL